MIKSLSLGIVSNITVLPLLSLLITGVLDYVSYMCNNPRSRGHHHKIKKKPNQTVEIKVKMDCEGCERRVRKSVEGMRGVEAKQGKLRVRGNVEPAKVVQRTGKKAELWPYVPYDADDNKAPLGYVRNAEQDPAPSALARANSTEVKYTMAFSDDNPNACALM